MDKKITALHYSFIAMIHSFEITQSDDLYKPYIILRAIELTGLYNTLKYCNLMPILANDEQRLLDKATAISVNEFNK